MHQIEIEETLGGAVLSLPYEIVKELGRGRDGPVCLADDPRSSRSVALKLLDDKSAYELGDALAASRLSDPGICSVSEIGEHASGSYLVMELVDGDSLEQVLVDGRHGGDPSWFLKVFSQVAASLAHAHREGVACGGLRMSSVLIRSDGRPVIVDFGQRPVGKSFEDSSRSDLLALARIMKRCFDETREDEQPRDLQRVLRRAARRSPYLAYADVQALVGDLNRMLYGLEVEWEEPGFLEHLRALTPLLAGGALSVAFALMLVLVAFPSSEGSWSIPLFGSRAAGVPRDADGGGREPGIERSARSSAEQLQRAADLLLNGEQSTAILHYERLAKKMALRVGAHPKDSELRLKLAKLQIRAAEICLREGERGRGERHAREALRVLSGSKIKGAREGSADTAELEGRIVLGRLLLAQQKMQAAKSELARALSVFEGKERDSKARKLELELRRLLRDLR